MSLTDDPLIVTFPTLVSVPFPAHSWDTFDTGPSRNTTASSLHATTVARTPLTRTSGGVTPTFGIEIVTVMLPAGLQYAGVM